ncbi:serine hydrolase [Ignavigranum ruoffiae]|uniref:D-alanyl-D-alanine carboxypeptidase family protein n=1 Tax=Ignavigranum ruoffiae TaxID=89093 RepID=UPI00205BC8AD|nr:serine hydrolase [Ignavigranum ruoffiae]UPQ85930.1 serine hydrolase [Ignavigranum ruoffiae]
MRSIKRVGLFVIILIIIVAGYRASLLIKYQQAYYSESIYVYNLTQDKVELAFNENKRRKQASLTKLMTAWVGLKYVENLDQMIPINEDVYLESVNNNASMAGFFGNESVTVRDLLYGTILPSGAECANTLATSLFDHYDNFIEIMNQEANRMALTNTHYENADGMDMENHYSSAKDVALLMKECIQDENYLTILMTPTYLSTPTLDHPDGIWMESTIYAKLINNEDYAGNILGGKSGTTEGAGLCWATLAEKNNQYYIIVVMGAPVGDIYNPNEFQVADTLKIINEL